MAKWRTRPAPQNFNPALAPSPNKASMLRGNAPAGSRTRGTSMGGLYVAATLQALLTNGVNANQHVSTLAQCTPCPPSTELRQGVAREYGGRCPGWMLGGRSCVCLCVYVFVAALVYFSRAVFVCFGCHLVCVGMAVGGMRRQEILYTSTGHKPPVGFEPTTSRLLSGCSTN